MQEQQYALVLGELGNEEIQQEEPPHVPVQKQPQSPGLAKPELVTNPAAVANEEKMAWVNTPLFEPPSHAPMEEEGHEPPHLLVQEEVGYAPALKHGHQLKKAELVTGIISTVSPHLSHLHVVPERKNTMKTGIVL